MSEIIKKSFLSVLLLLSICLTQNCFAQTEKVIIDAYNNLDLMTNNNGKKQSAGKIIDWIKSIIGPESSIDVNSFNATYKVKRGNNLNIFRSPLIKILEENSIRIPALDEELPDWTLSADISQQRKKTKDFDGYCVRVTYKLVKEEKEYTAFLDFNDNSILSTILGINYDGPGSFNIQDVLTGRNTSNNSGGIKTPQREIKESISDDKFEISIKTYSKENEESVQKIKETKTSSTIQKGSKDIEITENSYTCSFNFGDDFEICIKDKRNKGEDSVAVEVIVDGIDIFSLCKEKGYSYYISDPQDETIISGWVLSVEEKKNNVARFHIGKYEDTVAQKFALGSLED